MANIHEYVFSLLHPDESQYNPRFCRNITFQVTEDCNLNCSYCYQTHKTHKTMSIETGKAIVDFLYDLWEKNDPNAYLDQSTEMIILDFIGGEPLMNIGVIDAICEYFWTRAIEINSPWADTWMASMSSNGLLYFNPTFQAFAEKYQSHLSFGFSIDGGKTIHDACRMDYNGNGSFDRVYAALQDWKTKFRFSDETKVTIARENLPYLMDIVKFFYDEDFTYVNANVVYETDWTPEDAQLFYQKLKEMADFLLKCEKPFGTSLFIENFFRPLTLNDNENWCGGTGAMLAFDPDGTAYPCLRYMRSSLGDSQPPLIIGDCRNGIYQDEESKNIRDALEAITRRSQSTNECYYCPIAAGCSWCSAENYQRFGTANKRSTAICWMHRARALANSYYWNKKYRQENEKKCFRLALAESHALQIISEDELEMLKAVERENALRLND